MKILITGASGKIGKKLINKLLESNKYEIRILARNNNKKNISYNNIELAIGDLLNPNSLRNATAGADIIIHLAGLTHTNRQYLYYKVNALGTENLLKAGKNNKVKKFIFISSRTAGHKGGAYAQSKLLAEKKVRNSNLNWVILSLSEVYGAGKREAITRLINIVKKSYFVPIIGKGNYLLCPVHIDDVINSIISAVSKDGIINKKYIIAGPTEFSFNEIVDYLIRILCVKRMKIYIPFITVKFFVFIFYILKIDFIVKDQIPRLICKKPSDISLARKELNFNPRSFADGVSKILNSSE